jgi:peroxiredoxin
VAERYAEVRAAGGDVLAVSFAPPEAVAAFLRHTPLPFLLVSDPERSAYRAFGLERTSWPAILRPGVILRYLGLIFRGWRPRRPRPGEDLLQLGGDFVLDGAGRVAYAHRSAEPTDRPAFPDLLLAIRAAQ